VLLLADLSPRIAAQTIDIACPAGADSYVALGVLVEGTGANPDRAHSKGAAD